MSRDIESLRRIVTGMTPRLERGLKTSSEMSTVPEGLQLCASQCAVASAAVQEFLYEQYGIEATRVMKAPEKAPRELNYRRMSHVVLRIGDVMVDPTYGQFMKYVGLRHTVAEKYNLAHLYPEEKVAVRPLGNMKAFSDEFARHAYGVDRAHSVPSVSAEAADALQGAPLEDMVAVYYDIWDPAGYEPFPVENQPQLHDWIAKVVAHMNDATSLLS